MKAAIIIGIFILSVVVFFSGSLFGPDVFLDTNPYHYEPWSHYGSEDDLAGKTYRTDSFVTYLPRRFELSKSIRSGRFPLWNPYVFSGMPFYADPQTRVIYPISLLLVPLDPARAMGYDVAIHLLIAMIGMYLFLRSINLTTLGSLVGAFGYAFSSFFYLRMGHPTFIATAAWIPFFFFGFEKARQRERLGTTLLTVFLAMGYLAGFPQVFVFGVGALIIYGIYVSADRPAGMRTRNMLRTARVIGIACLLCALIVSVQLVPFIELVRNSEGLHIDFDKMRDVYLVPSVVLVRSLFPTFFGHPVEGTDWSRLTRGVEHPYSPEFTVYCGVGTLLAALGTLVFIRRSRRIRALWIIFLLSAGLAISPLLLKLAYRLLPVFRISRVSRIAVLCCFALASLGGIGISRASATKDRRLRRHLVRVVALIAVAAVLATVVFAAIGDSYVAGLAEKARSLPEKTWRRVHAQTRSMTLKNWAEGSGAEWFAYEKRQMLRGLMLVMASAALIILYAWPRGVGKRISIGLGVLFLLLVAFDAGLTARTYFISQPTSALFQTEGMRLLKRGVPETGSWRVRMVSYGDEDIRALPPNSNQIFGLPSFSGTSTIVPGSHTDLFNAFADLAVPRRLVDIDAPITVSELLLTNLACVRYTVTSSERPPYISSPVLRVVAARGGTPPRVRVLRFGSEARQAVVQGADEILNFAMDIPAVRALDFAMAFAVENPAPDDTIAFWLTWRGGGREIRFKRFFSMSRDRDRWHPFRLDISPASGSHVRIKMALTVSGAAGGKAVRAAWGGLDLVYDDCVIRRAQDTYEIETKADAEYLRLSLSSKAPEIPLGVHLSKTHKRVRWIGFPSHMPIREVTIDVRERAGDRIWIRSDSSFTLEKCRAIHFGPVYPDYELVSDEDMYIYENLAAVEKGVCISEEAMIGVVSGGESRLALIRKDGVADVICGTCKILSYQPERVLLDVRSDRNCFVLFQDTHYPGWRAYVDDVETGILKTDIGMRAIRVSQGNHKVLMKFKPQSLRTGLVLTVLGLTITAVYGAAPRTLRRK